MRACFSGACFVQAHTRETQQAFLEAHVAALEYYGASFSLIRYDNLKSAVKVVLTEDSGRQTRRARSGAACFGENAVYGSRLD